MTINIRAFKLLKVVLCDHLTIVFNGPQFGYWNKFHITHFVR
jgi:hypothetical protein